MIPITIGIGYMLLKTDKVIEVNLNSGDLVVYLPMSFSKFLYSKSEIIGYDTSIKDHLTKLPINSTYIDVEIIFYTFDLKVHRISSVTTINFDTFLEYFHKTYPMVSGKELKPIEEDE
ncbi:hypothetical protein, partial [uncultured Cytophaga sp.]|uniref:hypothetical protein n=1 Tax=uncultured Cytophaga sp. TaxID=160238 RepID=UPI00262A9479